MLLNAVCLESLMDILEMEKPAEKKGNERLLLKHILRYLHSEEVEGQEDERLTIFLKLRDVINKCIDDSENQEKKRMQSPVNLRQVNLF